MNIDQDFYQRFKVIGIFLLQFYKIMMGNLLTLFIPQACYESILINNVTKNNHIKICSINENIHNNNIYHKFTFYWNILSFLCFIISYLFELNRENWAIKYLDVDNNFPDNNLKKIIVNEPILEKQMDKLNFYYYYSLCITLFVYFINLLLMINILINDFHSMSTISTFFSFSLLVQIKLYNSFVISKESIKNDKIMSSYMCEFVSFNIIDKDYIISPNNKP